MARGDARRDELVRQYAAEPMRWFKHDSDSRRDEALRLLVAELGMEGYGRWWYLVECLAEHDGHEVDASTDVRLGMLAEDLRCDAGECSDFVSWLAGVGLVDAAAWDEGRVVRSARLMRNAVEAAEPRAAGTYGNEVRYGSKKKLS